MRNLSNRLLTIAGLVPKGVRVADIGTDHGYLPIYLTESGIAKKALACDINEKPLLSAKKNIVSAGAENIELRLCDGLTGIHPDEIDAAVIAGIGGEVISGIIDRCEWIKSDRYTLILQPTTSPERLREYLNSAGFSVEAEKAISDNGKLYSVMVVRFADKVDPLSPAELYIGKLTPNDDDATAYIKKQLRRVATLARDLENIPEKQAEYRCFSGVSKSLEALLGGK